MARSPNSRAAISRAPKPKASAKVRQWNRAEDRRLYW